MLLLSNEKSWRKNKMGVLVDSKRLTDRRKIGVLVSNPSLEIVLFGSALNLAIIRDHFTKNQMKKPEYSRRPYDIFIMVSLYSHIAHEEEVNRSFCAESGVDGGLSANKARRLYNSISSIKDFETELKKYKQQRGKTR